MSAVGEEKNLSFKEEASVGEGLVKVYCFPEIGSQAPPKNGSASRETPFFRSSFATDERPGKGRQNVPQAKVDLVGIPPAFAKEMETKAYNQGYREGEKAGMEGIRKEMGPRIRDLEEALRQMENIKKQISLTLEKETLGLALAVAKKIVGHEMKHNTQAIIKVVKEALSKVVDDNKIMVRLHPSQIQILERARGEFASLVNKVEAIGFEADPSLTPGGCVVETSFGEIDARIDRQFQVIEEAFDTEFQNAHQNS